MPSQLPATRPQPRRSLSLAATQPADGARERTHFACLGIGVGPANLSLASLLYRHGELPNLFLDKKERFGWHDGQSIPGASLQVSLLKDLVSLTDPTNPFSFLAYLHARGSIHQFINAQFDAMPRHEFRNYLEWASQHNENVSFGEEVLSVAFDERFVVRTSRRTLTADHVSIAIGNQPWVPQHARDKLGDTNFHVSDFVDKARGLGGKRVAVIGGGQSGAEAFLDLISRAGAELPRRVAWISRRRNYFPLDDSPFTNDFYMPCHSDHFFNLELSVRKAFNERHVLTSDGISGATLRDIYQRLYVHRFINDAPDLGGLYPNRTVTSLAGSDHSGWNITFLNNDDTVAESFVADVVVWASGFEPARTDLLAPIEHRLEREGGEYKIDEDFAVRWDGPTDHNIFVQNAARDQRGLADPNLSLVAWRSQRIVNRLRGVASDDPHAASFIAWSAEVNDDAQRRA